jgi:YHS domain-containing protein
MVRDRICNTYLPKEKALRLESGAEEHFFCSETCRERFLANRPRSGV